MIDWKIVGVAVAVGVLVAMSGVGLGVHPEEPPSREALLAMLEGYQQRLRGAAEGMVRTPLDPCALAANAGRCQGSEFTGPGMLAIPKREGFFAAHKLSMTTECAQVIATLVWDVKAPEPPEPTRIDWTREDPATSGASGRLAGSAGSRAPVGAGAGGGGSAAGSRTPGGVGAGVSAAGSRAPVGTGAGSSAVGAGAGGSAAGALRWRADVELAPQAATLALGTRCKIRFLADAASVGGI